MLTRVTILVVAVVACAWFALGARQARDIADASTIVSSAAGLSAAQDRHAEALLHAAKLLNPDTQPDVLRAQLYLDQGNRRAARSVLERVVVEEPDNAVAWEWLARASVGDLREFFLAAFRIDQLVPAIRGQR